MSGSPTGARPPVRIAFLVVLLARVVVARAGEVDVLPATVVRVVDGDTAVVQLQNQQATIRFFGIDAPEKSQSFGSAATKALRSLIEGESLGLEVVTQDRYDRIVARVWVGDTDVNAAMIEKGYAWAYRHYLNELPDARNYCQLEAAARGAHRGIWAAPAQEWQPPWDYRHRQRGEPGEDHDYKKETTADCVAAIPRHHRD